MDYTKRVSACFSCKPVPQTVCTFSADRSRVIHTEAQQASACSTACAAGHAEHAPFTLP